MASMSQEEVKACRVFFNHFDRSKSGRINVWELQIALEAMLQNPSDHDILYITQQLGTDLNGSLDFNGFVRAIQLQRELEKRHDNDEDFLAAFIAMGGQPDRKGSVSVDRLRRVIKDDFGLTFKIDELLEELETAKENHLNFHEFLQIFS